MKGVSSWNFDVGAIKAAAAAEDANEGLPPILEVPSMGTALSTPFETIFR